ncbi:hypothetical protein [Kitasatospora cineracea]|uniref:Uncharacterized protein n=1 Tax=Kitasatospora cineracea TaxID=88074 RepID=A0A3N4REY1_9ACTN|nr:hypothetical protein [Kitasatospora cineracea]RPE31872.1 hypothetical protein EDD38_0112 [Kitasatospora cineracea]
MSPLDVLADLQRRTDLMLPARWQYTTAATCAVATFIVFGSPIGVPVTAGMRHLGRGPDRARTRERRPLK